MEPFRPIPTNLDLLPNETIMNILLEVDNFETLVNWCQTSKRINNICQDNTFWKRKYEKDYDNAPSLPKVSWKIDKDRSTSNGQQSVPSWKDKYKFNYSARYSSPISAHRSGYSIVDEKGILYMTGTDELGRIILPKGLSSETRSIKLTFEPTLIPIYSKLSSASFSLTSVLTIDGDVYTTSAGPIPGGIFRKVELPEKVIKLSSRGTGAITKTNLIFVNIDKSPQLIPIRGIDISVSGITYAIICTDGKLYMWGTISFYKNGGNFTKEPKHIPLPELVKQVSLGFDHIAVLSITGNLYLWGSSGYGELGLGEKAASQYDNVYTKPQKLVLPEPVARVICGVGYTAAITENKKLYMWGQDPNDIIDSEGTARYRRDDHEDSPIVDSPVQVDIGHPVTFIALEFEYAIAVTDDGAVNLWGQNGLELLPNEGLPDDFEW